APGLLPADFIERLVCLFQAQCPAQDARGHGSPLCFLFQGPAGVGKKHTAAALCAAEGINLVVADVSQMLAHGAVEAVRWARLFREARLRAAAVYLEHAEALLGATDKAEQVRAVFFRGLAAFPGLVFLSSLQPWDVAIQSPDVTWFEVVFPRP